MDKIKKYFLILIVALFVYSVNADLGYDNPTLPKFESPPTISPTISSINISLNDSYWKVGTTQNVDGGIKIGNYSLHQLITPTGDFATSSNRHAGNNLTYLISSVSLGQGILTAESTKIIGSPYNYDTGLIIADYNEVSAGVSSASKVAGYFNATGGADTNYGLYSTASGATNNYGFYATASGGTNNYGGQIVANFHNIVLGGLNEAINIGNTGFTIISAKIVDVANERGAEFDNLYGTNVKLANKFSAIDAVGNVNVAGNVSANNLCYSNTTGCVPLNPFDQSLNTTDNVNFNSVNASNIFTKVINNIDTGKPYINLTNDAGYYQIHFGQNGVNDTRLIIHSDTANENFYLSNFGNYAEFTSDSSMLFQADRVVFTSTLSSRTEMNMYRGLVFGNQTFSTSTNAFNMVNPYIVSQKGFVSGIVKPSKSNEFVVNTANDGFRLAITNAGNFSNATTKFTDFLVQSDGGLIINSTGNITIDDDLKVTGNFSAMMPYAMLSDNTTQVIGVALTPQVVNFSTVEDDYLINLENKQNITVLLSGDYKIDVSAIFNVDLPNKHIEFWVQKWNGTAFVNIPRSNTKMELPTANIEIPLAVPFIIDLIPSEKIRFMLASDDAGSSMVYTTNTSYSPETPSIIISMYKIGEITP